MAEALQMAQKNNKGVKQQNFFLFPIQCFTQLLEN